MLQMCGVATIYSLFFAHLIQWKVIFLSYCILFNVNIHIVTYHDQFVQSKPAFLDYVKLEDSGQLY